MKLLLLLTSFFSHQAMCFWPLDYSATDLLDVPITSWRNGLDFLHWAIAGMAFSVSLKIKNCPRLKIFLYVALLCITQSLPKFSGSECNLCLNIQIREIRLFGTFHCCGYIIEKLSICRWTEEVQRSNAVFLSLNLGNQRQILHSCWFQYIPVQIWALFQFHDWERVLLIWSLGFISWSDDFFVFRNHLFIGFTFLCLVVLLSGISLQNEELSLS